MRACSPRGWRADVLVHFQRHERRAHRRPSLTFNTLQAARGLLRSKPPGGRLSRRAAPGHRPRCRALGGARARGTGARPRRGEHARDARVPGQRVRQLTHARLQLMLAWHVFRLSHLARLYRIRSERWHFFHVTVKDARAARVNISAAGAAAPQRSAPRGAAQRREAPPQASERRALRKGPFCACNFAPMVDWHLKYCINVSKSGQI